VLIGEHLIGMLDGSGYLAGDLDALALTLGCERELIEQILARMQLLDPAGVFARDLQECLALQLKDKDRFDPAMAALLDNLEMVAKREFTQLTKICGVDMEDIADMVEEIKSLDPKPALSFDHEITQPITPDVLMRAIPGEIFINGVADNVGWTLELNSNNLPRVLINNQYFSTVTKETSSKKDIDYLNEQMQTANWLVKAMHQRATTILKVSSEIVRQQDAFFRHGVQHLKPLVLRDIAEIIDMHESTVSRVTSNKYIATPRGIYELKYFFTSSISSSSGGEAISAESVRHKIKEMIDSENPKKILSDDKIAEILKREGTDVARRTVAKYRESLNLGSSVQRRREKSAPK
jgi:RNA polymerase sigma-54 factor